MQEITTEEMAIALFSDWASFYNILEGFEFRHRDIIVQAREFASDWRGNDLVEDLSQYFKKHIFSPGEDFRITQP